MYACVYIYIYIPVYTYTHTLQGKKYPTFGKRNHLQKCLGRGYVGSQEGIYCEMKMGNQNRKREEEKLVMVRYAKRDIYG